MIFSFKFFFSGGGSWWGIWQYYPQGLDSAKWGIKTFDENNDDDSDDNNYNKEDYEDDHEDYDKKENEEDHQAKNGIVATIHTPQKVEWSPRTVAQSGYFTVKCSSTEHLSESGLVGSLRVLFCTVQYCTWLCCTVHYCTVQYCTLQYSTVQFCTLRTVLPLVSLGLGVSRLLKESLFHRQKLKLEEQIC